MKFNCTDPKIVKCVRHDTDQDGVNKLISVKQYLPKVNLFSQVLEVVFICFIDLY